MADPQATCAGCGSALNEHHGNRRYCSEPCRKRSEKQRRAERDKTGEPFTRKCARCGIAFVIHDTRGGRRYCSDECRGTVYNEARRLTDRPICQRNGCTKKLSGKNLTGFCIEHRVPRPRPRTCEVCASSFLSVGPRKVCDDCLRCTDCGTIVKHGAWGCETRRCASCRLRAGAASSLGRAMVRLRRGILMIEREASKPAPQRFDMTCGHCGQAFTTRYATARWCSQQCSTRASSQRGNAKRRARKTAAFRANVYRAQVAERDQWTCQICRKRINPQLQYPHPKSLALDHIVPLAIGGTHEPANVQAAHWICNSLKGAQGQDQLRLIG